jgi:hypothetical protein
MGVQSMCCPKCGRPASEYAPSKWQCLHCQTRFIYEPPPQPDQYIKVETVTKFDDMTFFECAKCHGKFPKMSSPEYCCKTCGNTFCKSCMSVYAGHECKNCRSAREVRMFIGFLSGVFLICAGFLMAIGNPVGCFVLPVILALGCGSICIYLCVCSSSKRSGMKALGAWIGSLRRK